MLAPTICRLPGNPATTTASSELNAIRKYIRFNPAHWTKEAIPWNEDAYAWVHIAETTQWGVSTLT